MITAVFLPWFVTITCLELAFIFLLLYRYVNAAQSNALFSGLCLCFACMTWSTAKLVHAESMDLGLLWYRIELVSNIFTAAVGVHFTRSLTQTESVPASPALSSRSPERFALRLYGLTALIALSACHPLILLKPSHVVPVGDYDGEMAGPFFPLYNLLCFAGAIYMCALIVFALRRAKRAAGKTGEEAAGNYRAFAGDFRWLLFSFALVVIAGLLEFLQVMDLPNKDFHFPIFPRALAVLVFCITTAWSLGKQVVATERRKEQLQVIAQTRLESAMHAQHQVKNALAQIARPLHNVLDTALPTQPPTANHQRVARAVAAIQELHHTLDVALNLARVEVGEPLNLGVKESVPIAAFVETLCRRRLNLEETRFFPAAFFPSASASPSCNFSPASNSPASNGYASPTAPRAADASLLEFHADVCAPQVFVYADALREVFAVLLDNAVKYAPPDSPITVRVWDEAEQLRFCVTDQGCGVRPEDQERIFTLYRGQHTTAERVAGTGVGLTLAKRYIEAHGGRIWVESAGEGKGSAFCIRLPLEPDVPFI